MNNGNVQAICFEDDQYDTAIRKFNRWMSRFIDIKDVKVTETSKGKVIIVVLYVD